MNRPGQQSSSPIEAATPSGSKGRRRLHPVLQRVLIYPVLGYLVICGFTYFYQDHLLYFPSNELDSKPDAAFEQVTVTSADGIALQGWFFPLEKPRYTVHFSHGNGGNRSHCLMTAEFWLGLGCQVLLYDYRGYGTNPGKPSESGLYRDSRAFWDWLVTARGIRPESIILHGRSLGAAMALDLALQVDQKTAGVILESAFLSVPRMGSEIYPYLPVRLLSRASYDNAAKIGRLQRPVLVIHSPDDEVIPFRHGQELFRLAHQPKQFTLIHGDHNAGFLLSDPDYRGGIRRFLDRLGQTPPAASWE